MNFSQWVNMPINLLRRTWHKLRPRWSYTRIILGASHSQHPNWLPTEQSSLDITRHADFAKLWSLASRDAFLAEHVWEHLTAEQALVAMKNCLAFLKPGGHLRIAVPDGYHPDPEYIEAIKPGGHGPGSDDHQQLYTYQTIQAQLATAGFMVELKEYWHEDGHFVQHSWDIKDGMVTRSAAFDPRNQPRNHHGELRYTSIIVDGIKPA